MRALTARVRGFTHKHQLESLRAEELRWRALASDDFNMVTMGFVALIYMAMSYIIKALLMVCLGLIFGSVIPVFGNAGFLLAIYFLLRAANSVRDTKPNVVAEEELQKVLEKIDQHEKRA